MTQSIPREWTVMVYMAGDNGKLFDGVRLMADLQAYGWRNIADMSNVGSSDQVAVVVQYDTLDEQQHTPRLLIDGQDPTGQLVDKISPVNTGDPRNLTDFIVWAMTAYPAERFALVLWNHGTGWQEDDIYARFRETVEPAIRDGETRAGSRGTRILRRAMFLTTAASIMSIEDDDVRGICYDDTSMDFLDNLKLAEALNDARETTGHRLSVLGMDACLMSTLEVAYQVRHCADYLVASQEVEEASGWPYGSIMKRLAQCPEMTAAELSQLVVEQFGAYYLGVERHGGGINTQTAVDLRAIELTHNKVRTISDFLLKACPSDLHSELAIRRARDRAQSFYDVDSLDLRDLVERLGSNYDGTMDTKLFANDLAQHLGIERVDGPIIANFAGSRRPDANGMSIYFPSRDCSPFYARQAFASSKWHEVIAMVNKL